MKVESKEVVTRQSINERVLIPNVYSGGIREPRTTINVQPLNGRILVKASYNITNFELVGMDTSQKNHENAMLQRKWDKLEVVGYGAMSSQVEIGDELVLMDSYSAVSIPVTDDPQWYKNVIQELSAYKSKLLNKFDSKKSSIIVPVNPILDNMESRNEKEFNTKLSEVHVYFMIDEFIISHRVIKYPNA